MRKRGAGQDCGFMLANVDDLEIERGGVILIDQDDAAADLANELLGSILLDQLSGDASVCDHRSILTSALILDWTISSYIGQLARRRFGVSSAASPRPSPTMTHRFIKLLLTNGRLRHAESSKAPKKRLPRPNAIATRSTRSTRSLDDRLQWVLRPSPSTTQRRSRRVRLLANDHGLRQPSGIVREVASGNRCKSACGGSGFGG